VKERQTCDILIVGGGVIGLSIARELHKRGARQITVIDQGKCGREASWAAAGMLGPQAEADDLDSPFFKLCLESRDIYPRFAEDLLAETGIDIELDRTGTLALAFNEVDSQQLMDRYHEQRDAGLVSETLSAEELARREPYISAGAQIGLLFENDWQVENRKLVEALTRYAELSGIDLIEDTAIRALSVGNGRVSGAETTAGRYEARTTVLTTGAWTSFIKLGDAALPFMVEPVRGQIIVLRPSEKVFVHVVHTPRGYIVPRADGRFLVGSTSEHVGFDKSVTHNAAEKLLEAACETSPFFKSVEISDHWSGLRPSASDEMPVLGEIGGMRDLFVATAHYRNGILLAPVTARLAAERLVGGLTSKYFGHFGPGRFHARGAGGN
jgi:glycine oxidase